MPLPLRAAEGQLPAIAITAGHGHTVIHTVCKRTGAAQLRAFGSNERGQLGLPWLAGVEDRPLPTVVDDEAMHQAAVGSVFAKKGKEIAIRREEQREEALAIDLAQDLFAMAGGYSHGASPSKLSADSPGSGDGLAASMPPGAPAIRAAEAGVSPPEFLQGWWPKSRN